LTATVQREKRQGYGAAYNLRVAETPKPDTEGRH
jgi:hypothetical protein